MFTGLIETTGTVVSFAQATSSEAATLVISAQDPNFHAAHGDSIAVNGCCLTRSNHQGKLEFHLNPETLAVTSLSTLVPGLDVNLERALRMGDRLGGHLVSGHVDACGKITGVQPQLGGNLLVGVEIPRGFGALLIPKGSLTIDGVSLTINQLKDHVDGASYVEVMLIPTTLSKTTLQKAQKNQIVNLEFDITGKYILRHQSLNRRPV
jgi:riboflavin synthase